MWIKLPDKRIVDVSQLCIIGPYQVLDQEIKTPLLKWEVCAWVHPHDYIWAKDANRITLYKDLETEQETEECVNALFEELQTGCQAPSSSCPLMNAKGG